MVRERLDLVERVRAFADGVGLEAGDLYTSYVAWPGDRVVTTVVASRPGEVSPADFWFPIVGRVPYKGYFDPALAEAEARRLRQSGLDVCSVPVRAYSTLGWFDDPVTGPMLRQEEGELVETILHELVHATFYVPDHASFNEGVASFIGEESRVRFYARESGEIAAERERQWVRDGRRIRSALLDARREVEALYAETEPGEARESARRALEADARRRLATLPLTTRDPAQLAERLRLNDACLALTGTYAADAARYAVLLEALGGDLRVFVARAREAARDPGDPLGALMRLAPQHRAASDATPR